MRGFSSALFLLVTAVFGLLIVLGDESVDQLIRLRESVERQRAMNGELHSAVASGKRKLERVRYDDAYLERVVREELLLSKPNDLVFIFEAPVNGLR